MIPVTVDQLFLSNMGFVVMLKERDGTRSLPVFIGAAEAQAIAIPINGVEMPRPLTHDLLKNLLDFLECRLRRVVVSDLREGTFYARMVLERDEEEADLDSRPSDAIALALRFDAPIFVAEHVMQEAGRAFDGTPVQGGQGHPQPAPPSGPPASRLSPREALEQELERAVRDERYEEAARLRDEIKRLDNAHGEN